MKTYKRMLALLLVLLMFVSLLPVGAVAADAEPAEDAEEIEILQPAEDAETPTEDPAAEPDPDPADPAADPDPAEPGPDPAEPDPDPAEPDPDPADPAAVPDADADADAADEAELETQATDPVEDEETGLVYTISGDKATIVGYNGENPPTTLNIQKLGGKWVAAIADEAFLGCASLQNITLSDKVKTIGFAAFAECTALQSIELPKGVDVGEHAFNGCTSLAAVTFDKNVGTIGASAFEGCTALESIALPDGVTSIPASMFSGCSSLSSVTLPNSLRTIGERAFFNCAALEGITLPDKLTAIGNYAFCGSGLLSIDIPDSVTSISEYAFTECYELAAVRLSNSLKTISQEAFSCCFALQSIEIPNGVTSIGESAFDGCTSLTEITIPDSVTSIGEYALSCCEALESATLPAGLRTIPDGLFSDCSALTSVTLPDSLTAIGDWAFIWCKALADVTLPDGLTEIGNEAFRGCALTSISLPNSLRTIGSDAFGDCTGLSSIVIPNSVTRIYPIAFTRCTALTEVRLPDGIGKIEKDTFEGCSALESIVIPDGVTVIEEEAFRDCSSLQSITIPASVTSIGNRAFRSCPDLTKVYYTGTEEQADALKANTGVWNDALLAAEWVLVTETGDAPTIVFERDYLIMRDDEDKLTILTATAPGGIPESAEVSWSVDNESVIPTLIPSPVDTENGVARALIIPGGETGTAWVTVTLRTTAGSCSARCRIDKTAGAVLPTLEDVTLTESKATVEVFRTDYTRITVVPNLTQNDFGTMSSLIDGIPDYEEYEYNGDYAVRKAEFDDPKNTGINDYFRLRVVDDRTLEIVPTRKALEDAEAKNPALKATYKNAVKVWVDGEGDENAFTTGPLTLTVKKTLPRLKAAPVKLNSFIKDEAQLSITGGTVTKITAIEGATPEWLVMPAPNAHPVDLTVKYDGPIHSDAPKSQKASLKLTVEAEGWAIRQTVPVTVTAAPVLPKVTFSTKTLTMNPKDSTCIVCFTVSPAEYMTNGCVDFAASAITENGKTVGSDVLRFNGEPTTDTAGNMVFKLSFGPGSGFGSMAKARTFKFNLDVGGKKFPLTIKTLPENKAELGISVKTKGVIDTAVPNSPVTLDITLNGNSYIDPRLVGASADGAAVIVKVTRAKGGGEEEFVNGFGGSVFTETVDATHARITLRQTNIETSSKPLDLSYTYTAKLEVTYNGSTSEKARAEVKIPIKSSDPAKMPLTVTAKTKGKIDVLRPDSEILLTPTIKNGYGFDLGNGNHVSLTFLRKVGKDYETARSGLFTYEVDETGTAFRIRMNPGYGVDVKKDKFAVRIAVRDPADSNRMARIKTPVNLPLTMGKAKITQSTKTLTLLKRDKYSSAVFTLTPTDPALKITSVRITNDKLGLYQLTELGTGQYAISYSGRMLAAPKKGTTLKLAVTLAGNNTNKPNATISLAIKFA